MIVTTFAAHDPVTPVGKPVTVAPVAPVVAYVMFVIAVLIQTICAFVPIADVSVTVLVGLTVTIIETGAPSQPLELVSIIRRVAVPTLVQLTVIKFGVAPGVIVPLPPARGVMLHV